ncbi:MAG: alpha/beta fold hydrolase [bacterium]|nr:alpha/beta fold hydrolase [bacterium]
MSPTTRLPGLVLTDREFTVPLDHAKPDGETIAIFGREVVSTDNEPRELPWLVFFQGGPGFGAPRPMDASGWLGRALQDHRVLLLDERGTGRSTPQSFQTLARIGDAAAQARHLTHFRTDSIVRDAELVRRKLIGEQPWTVLGQSYGGFCVVRYLSAAPEGLAAALVTGGLPGLEATCDDIYRRTYPHVIEKNRRYYERYPDDVDHVKRIAERIAEDDVRLPNGERLSVRRFQQLGLLLGFSDGFELMHYLLEDAFVPGTDELSYTFLRGFENALHFDTNPIFSVLHEACYTQGSASRWSAERLRPEFGEFEPGFGGPLHFTGEMIYPWMFEEIRALQPLRDTAHELAAWEGWPALYDQDALARSEVPCAAAIYANDMYVDRAFSEETAARIGALRPWLTDEYEHNGLRADGARVLGRLLDMVHGRT